ncbi:hypothetical protein LDZ95_19025 [Pseudomonas aeruginosa]|nr:hypothetical protein [Pseudomonas aeruginosa]
MSTHEINLKLSSAQLFILGIALGVAIGIPVGVAAYQYGWSQGSSGQHANIQVGVSPLDDDAVCVNGVAYAPDRTDTYPAWQGVYRPLTQGQHALIGEDGREVLQRAIPVRCTIQRG